MDNRELAIKLAQGLGHEDDSFDGEDDREDTYNVIEYYLELAQKRAYFEASDECRTDAQVYRDCNKPEIAEALQKFSDLLYRNSR